MGRYTISLAHEGYQLNAIELIQHNLDVLKSKITETDKVEAIQGNAIDLSMYSDDTFDILRTN